jgi:predicted short-subunit dehydrogenase-like oxidoreductase (DUF2520 family)
MKVVIVGSGNVAAVLSTLVQKAGHQILQIVSRNADHARALAATHKVEGIGLNEPEFAAADIYIVAFSDSALASVEKITALKGKFLVHTAGSVSKDVFKNISSTYGVLYPLQTLSILTQETPEIPFLIEGNTKESLHQLSEFAKTLSNLVIPATEMERLHYHVAAVFAGNFTNHLYAIAENFCEKEKIDFKNLLPLINEVTAQANHNSPRTLQTGPAMREDIFTLNRHLQTLTPHPDLKYLYLKLSESILKLYEKH